MFLMNFDTNVLKPISQRGHEEAYDQFMKLLSKIEPNIGNQFIPYYAATNFFEQIGKGNLWGEINIYEKLSIHCDTFNDKKKLAEKISEITEEIIEKIKNHDFFSKKNLINLYKNACSDFIGNTKARDLLKETFHRFGKEICDLKTDHLNLIASNLFWDRLVVFPVYWKKPEYIQDKLAKDTWSKAEKFYDCLLASYHNQKLINLDIPFTRLLLHRRFIDHLLKLKHLRHERKNSRWLKRWINLYQINHLKVWIEEYRWAFKPNNDLVDVELLHFAIYGIFNKENVLERRPMICVTCDPAKVVEARLFLCMTSNNELNQQVKGWNLPLCPGRIICLNYQNSKFSHVKTIDVQKFFQEQCNFKNRFNRIKFKLRLFVNILKIAIKATIKMVRKKMKT